MDIKGIDKRRIAEKIKVFTPIIEIIARGFIGFLLSRGIVFGEYAPFGIAWCAVGGAPGTIGAILGYISVLYKTNGLKYMAICILIYTAKQVFKETEIIKKRGFMPIITMVCTMSTGFVFVIESGDVARSAIFYAAEILLATLCAYFYSYAMRGRSKGGITVLTITLILPLTTVRIFDISLGRVIAESLTLILGFFGGCGMGGGSGIALSFATGGQMSAIYGLSGLVAPIFRSRGKIFYSAAFLAVCVSAMLWFNIEVNYETIAETLVAIPVFALAVRFGEDKIRAVLSEEEKPKEVGKIQKNIGERIDMVGDAILQLAYIFSGKREEERISLSTVFDAPAQKVCKKCPLAKTCWEREFSNTRDALDFVMSALENKSRLEKEDFPNHFTARCIKTDEFINEANAELFKVLYRRKCKAQIEESRGILKKQYSEMAKMILRLKDELNLTEDLHYEAKISDFLEKNEIRAYPTAYRDGQNHLHIEISGDKLSRLCCEEFAADLSDFIGVRVTNPEFDTKTENIKMRQKENLKVIMGASLSKRKGTEISGDAGSYFRTDDGMAIVLADGMGSGREAACASSNAIKMAERFCRAKIDMGLSLSAINTALTLKSEEDSAFTTVDFMEINLYSGKAKLYKLGSAATYLRHNGKIRKIGCSSLPAGVPAPSKNRAEQFNLQTYPGDILVFVTDGVADAEDVWIEELIANYKGTSPRELSAEIIAAATARREGADDMTVLAAYVDKNG